MTIKATKKPVTIEAVTWDGENSIEIKEFCGESAKLDLYHSLDDGKEHIDLHIHTLEGNHHASVGDYIIKGVNGEFYPCKPDIFEKTYDICGTNENDSHNFGWALENLKAGKKVQRKGWNGKGMFITLQRGSTVDGELMRNAPAKEYYTGKKCNIAPHIDMKAADDSYTVGWAPSQPDMMAMDWQIAE